MGISIFRMSSMPTTVSVSRIDMSFFPLSWMMCLSPSVPDVGHLSRSADATDAGGRVTLTDALDAVGRKGNRPDAALPRFGSGQRQTVAEVVVLAARMIHAVFAARLGTALEVLQFADELWV